jgi:type I restriction enzyme, S subunit
VTLQLPPEWDLERLDAVASIVTGTTPSPSVPAYYGSHAMFVTPADLGSAKYVHQSRRGLSAKGLARARSVPAGSTLFVCIGSTIGKVGLTVESVATNQQINALVPNGRVDGEYLYYAAMNLSRVVRERASEQAVPLVNKTELSGYTISLPPRVEQARIARALADADALIVALERLLAKTRDIKEGVAQQLLTGRNRLSGYDAPWETVSLGHCGRCLRGVAYDPQRDLATGDRPTTYRLLRANNVQDGMLVLDELQFVAERRVSRDQVLSENDIVICMANGSRALVGKAALFQLPDAAPRYTFGAFMSAFRTSGKKADPRYLAQLLLGKRFRDWLDVILAGSSINNLRPSDVEAFTVPMPALDEQTAIADVLADVDAEIAVLRRRLAKAKAIKEGMAQQLLAGRVRLPDLEPVA